MNSTLYTDFYSGIEVLCISTPGGEVLGAAYNPRATTSPVPWRSCCRHCAGGRSADLDIHAKRAIQLLVSQRRVGEYTNYKVPTNTTPLDLALSTKPDGTVVASVASPTGDVLKVSRNPSTGATTYDGDRRQFQSPILTRLLKFLFSARPALPHSIIPCVLPLHVLQQSAGPQRGRSIPCKKIAWQAILDEMTRGNPR